MIKIALVGTHNTGKTTLFEMMKQDKLFSGYYFVPEQIRIIHSHGYGINENADDCTQLALALENQYYSLLTKSPLTYEGIVLDRCILDNYIYAKYLNKKGIVTDKVLNTLKETLDRTLPFIHYIFFLRPGFDMESDEERSTNEDFQLEIDNMFREFFEENKHKYYYRELTGTSKERLELIKEIITGGYVY